MKANSRMFWLVWNEQRNPPKLKHWSEQQAKEEAMRLARQHPGDEFHVLALTASCGYQAVIWRKPTPAGFMADMEDEIAF